MCILTYLMTYIATTIYQISINLNIRLVYFECVLILGQVNNKQDFFFPDRSRVDVYTSQSQCSQFHHFLLRANKYQALSLVPSNSNKMHHSTQPDSCRTVIVVEELPNSFYRDPAQFHNTLR